MNGVGAVQFVQTHTLYIHKACTPTHTRILLIFLKKKKKQLNHSGIEPEAMRTGNSAGNATEDYSWVCGFHEPFFD